MATQAAPKSDFIKNLGRMYGTYTGGFLAFIVLLAILEQVGVPKCLSGEFLNRMKSFVIQGWRPDSEGPPMWTNENRGRYDRSRLRYPSDLTDDEWSLG